MKIKTQEISSELLEEKQIRLFIKRIDQNNEYISGNKLYKLKYNLIEARKLGVNSILTFGGAYSNHIAATAFAAKENRFSSIGLIRGEESLPLNSTLKFAQEHGMRILYLSRDDYRNKDNYEFIENLKNRFGDFHLIPEGGANMLGVKGASEIIDINDSQDFICSAVGTGSTIAGVINASNYDQNVIGFPAIKGSGLLESVIKNWTSKKKWELVNDYSFGGYAKVSDNLIDFINNFYLSYGIPLDAVYTGKMMFGVLDLALKDYFPKGSSVLAIHTGGLQGNKGINERFKIQLPLN